MQLNNVDETLRKAIVIKELIEKYDSLIREDNKLYEMEVLKVNNHKIPDIEIPVGKSIKINCSENVEGMIANYFDIPCGELYIDKIILDYGYNIEIYYYSCGRIFCMKKGKASISLSPLVLGKLLLLHFFNEKIDLLTMLEAELTRRIGKKEKWVELLKELASLVKLVINESKV